MKIAVFEVYAEEKPYFAKMREQGLVDLRLSPLRLTEETLGQVDGCEAVSVLDTSMVDAAMLDALAARGVRFVCTRTIGFNHIDVAHAARAGIRVCNVSYGPDGVAEYTVMLMLMCLRKCKTSIRRSEVNDYTLTGLAGRELRSMTVGIVGTGRIGRTVMEKLAGFGCSILAYDPFPNADIEAKGLYVSLEDLYRRADVISLHIPLNDQVFHMINEESLALMKDGVILINTARGGLADTEALIAGIESGKIGALGLDVIEHEDGIYRIDRRTAAPSNRDMAYLRQFPNVTLTPHLAFYTEEDVESMVVGGVKNLLDMREGASPFELRP